LGANFRLSLKDSPRLSDANASQGYGATVQGFEVFFDLREKVFLLAK
jgi:hypothetical protein